MTQENTGTAIPGEEVPIAPAEDDAAIEARARASGWKDRDEFDRPPERWRSAKEFLEVQDRNVPVLRENLHRVEAQLGTLQATNAGLKDEVSGLRVAFEHVQSLAMTAEQRAYERAKTDFAKEKREIEARIDTAAATADVAGVKTAREALSALKEPVMVRTEPPPKVRTEVAPANPAGDPVETAAVQAFAAENRWFKSSSHPDGNDEATEYASARYGTLQRTRPDLNHAQRLVEVKKSVSARFPELFTAPGAGSPQRVAAPSGGGPSRSGPSVGKSWNDVPSEDRAAAAKIISDVNKGRKDGKKFTEAEYAALYFQGKG